MKAAYRKWISKKLRDARESKGLSVRAVARILDIKRTTYIAYEEGRSEPNLYNFERICKLYGIKVSDFFKNSPLSKIL